MYITKENGGLGMKRMTAAVLILAFLLTIGSISALAQAEPEAAAAANLRAGHVWHFFGAAIGLGMVVIGAALGIGRFAAAAAEGIARQPSAADRITAAVNLPLFLLEGVAIIAEVVILLIVFLK
jgi:F-type H+-transporting ATPase subunit c